MKYKEKFLETINKTAEEEQNKVKINKYYIDVLENQDKVIESKNKVITVLLKKIANLEREVERLNNIINKAIEYIESNAPWGEETEDGDFVSGKLLQDDDIDYVLEILKGE